MRWKGNSVLTEKNILMGQIAQRDEHRDRLERDNELLRNTLATLIERLHFIANNTRGVIPEEIEFVCDSAAAILQRLVPGKPQENIEAK